MRRTGSLVLAIALAATSLAALPDRSAAATKPNLTVPRITTPAQATVGRTATFKVTVRNSGGRAGPSKVRLFLSNDGRHDRKDVSLGTIGVRAIGGGDARTVQGSFTMPAETGPRRIVACADSGRVIAETNERDNCRVSRATVFIWPRPEDYVAGTPDPRDVTPTLGTKTATKAIGTEGGTLSLSAGGDTFTLDVPANALASTVDVTMRPITAVDGLGMSGGLLAGVDLAPDGLRFLRPVTLAIDPGESVPLARQAGFAYAGDGTDLHAYGLERGQVITMKLMHFTGAGVGDATAADRTAQQQRVPAGTEARYEQQQAVVLDLLRQAHDAALAGTDPETAKELENEALAAAAALAVAHLRDVVIPALKTALAGDTTRTGSAAIVKFLTAARQLALLGVQDAQAPALAEGWRLVRQILDKVIPDAHNRCVTEKNPGMALVMLSAERARQLMGSVGDAPLTIEKMEKCLRFELDFEFLVSGPAYTSGDTSYDAYGYHTRAPRVPVRVSLTSPAGGTGSGPHEYLEYYGRSVTTSEHPGGTCTGTATPAGTIDGVFEVTGMIVDLNYYNHDPEVKRVDFRLDVSIDPGQFGAADAPKDITDLTASHPDCDVPRGRLTSWFWAATFNYAHADEAVDPAGSAYQVRGWTAGMPGTPVLATKTYDRDLPGEGDAHELTTLLLRHTPVQ